MCLGSGFLKTEPEVPITLPVVCEGSAFQEKAVREGVKWSWEGQRAQEKRDLRQGLPFLNDRDGAPDRLF